MNIISALILTAVSGAIEMSIAPDQPLPYVYVDDPLVLEFTTTEDVQAQIQLEIKRDGVEDLFSKGIEQVSLRTHGSRWIPIKDAPAARGHYTLKAIITVGGETLERSGDFYRVDRPGTGGVQPAYAHGGETDPRTLMALSSVGVRTIRVDASSADIDQRLKDAVRQKFRAVIYLDPTQIPEPAALVERLSRAHCADITRWEINPHGDPAMLQLMAETLRQAGCNASLAVVVPDAATLGELMQFKSGHRVREAVLLSDTLDSEDVASLRRQTEQAGYEAWRLNLFGRGVPAGASNAGLVLAHQILRNLAAGVAQTGFSSELVYSETLQPAGAYLNGLSQRVTATEFVGDLSLGEGVTALVFRDDADWFVALWAESARPARLPLSGAERVLITDAFNNEFKPELNGKEEAVLQAEPAPIYVTGRHGVILGRAATHAAMRQAREFRSAFQSTLGGELLDVVAAVEKEPGGGSGRINFFSILRALPDLERRWHAGELPRNVAAPAIAQLARLARSLATVEEQRGEVFLEMLPDTLAHGEELQSLYLTGSTGSSEANERGDWLVDEVRRLLDEAKELSESNRGVEACAVAALAEWRARGLEFAAHAKPASEDAVAVVAALPPPVVPVPVEPLPEPPVAATEPAPAAEPPPVPPVPVETPAPQQDIIHKVASGESPSFIADKYKVKLEDLLEWNKLGRRSRLKIGQELVIRTAATIPAPEETQAATPAPEPEPAPPVEETPLPAKTHKVARNENPSIIADKYKISLEDFLKWNNFKKNVKFQIGQEVLVSAPGTETAAVQREEAQEPAAPEVTAPEPAPAPEEAPEAPAESANSTGKTKKITHTVKKGDTPASIAKQYGVDLEAFRKLNGLRRNATLAAGKKYSVMVPQEQAGPEPQSNSSEEPAPSAPQSESDAPEGLKKIIHKVGRGDNPYIISKKYGVELDEFLTWNKLKKTSMLQIGQEMTVFVKK